MTTGISKISEQNLEKKFLAFALVVWLLMSIAIGIFFALMLVGPNQTMNYFMWSTFDMSVIVFIFLGLIFVPFILIDLFRISR